MALQPKFGLGWNYMDHRKALQSFPDTSQVSPLKKTKIKVTYKYIAAVSTGSREVTVTFNFISECTVFVEFQ
jgi:hypothetical protein